MHLLLYVNALRYDKEHPTTIRQVATFAFFIFQFSKISPFEINHYSLFCHFRMYYNNGKMVEDRSSFPSTGLCPDFITNMNMWWSLNQSEEDWLKPPVMSKICMHRICVDFINETPTQRCFIVIPTSATLAQHWTRIGWAYNVCWESLPVNIFVGVNCLDLPK